jgi:hypothetical protein
VAAWLSPLADFLLLSLLERFVLVLVLLTTDALSGVCGRFPLGVTDRSPGMDSSCEATATAHAIREFFPDAACMQCCGVRCSASVQQWN